jgi:hypothetical protein
MLPTKALIAKRRHNSVLVVDQVPVFSCQIFEADSFPLFVSKRFTFREWLDKDDLCCTLERRLTRGSHGRQPSMANLGLDHDGARRYFFRNLAAPCRLYCSRLRLRGCISLARTAVCSLVDCSETGSVRCQCSIHFMVAAPSPVNRMSSRRGGLRDRCLFVAIVARGMAGWSRIRSFRRDCIGSGDDYGDSISQKVSGAHPVVDSEIDRRQFLYSNPVITIDISATIITSLATRHAKHTSIATERRVEPKPGEPSGSQPAARHHHRS